MTLAAALRAGEIPDRSFRSMQLHVVTPDGRLGVVEAIDAPKGFASSPDFENVVVILRHFNGEPFDQEFTAGACELLARR